MTNSHSKFSGEEKHQFNPSKVFKKFEDVCDSLHAFRYQVNNKGAFVPVNFKIAKLNIDDISKLPRAALEMISRKLNELLSKHGIQDVCDIWVEAERYSLAHSATIAPEEKTEREPQEKRSFFKGVDLQNVCWKFRNENLDTWFLYAHCHALLAAADKARGDNNSALTNFKRAREILIKGINFVDIFIFRREKGSVHFLLADILEHLGDLETNPTKQMAYYNEAKQYYKKVIAVINISNKIKDKTKEKMERVRKKLKEEPSIDPNCKQYHPILELYEQKDKLTQDTKIEFLEIYEGGYSFGYQESFRSYNLPDNDFADLISLALCSPIPEESLHIRSLFSTEQLKQICERKLRNILSDYFYQRDLRQPKSKYENLSLERLIELVLEDRLWKRIKTGTIVPEDNISLVHLKLYFECEEAFSKSGLIPHPSKLTLKYKSELQKVPDDTFDDGDRKSITPAPNYTQLYGVLFPNGCPQTAERTMQKTPSTATQTIERSFPILESKRDVLTGGDADALKTVQEPTHRAIGNGTIGSTISRRKSC